MQSPGSWPMLVLFPLSFLIYLHPSLAFSLKNCTIVHPEDANNLLVTCSKRGLTAVPDDIPRNVTSLELSINYILNITSTDLRRLSKLVSVQADQNAILHIADGAFADLEALRTLNLSYNHLSKLTDNMFKGLFKLVTLSLSSNLIRSISPLAFQSLESINSINLIDNYLYQIADIIPILKLPTLQDLSLGANWLTSFQSDDLPVNVSNLTLLQLAMNPLRKFSIRRDIFPDLEILDLMGCNSMEWDIANKTFLSSLRTLMLGGVKVNLETYRAMLQTTDSIHEFKMYFMNTMVDEELIDTACQIPSLRALDVRYNYITAIDDNLLRSCSRLTELTVSFSRLSELSEHSLRSMTQLRRLALNNNFLHHLQLAVQGLSTLEILDLSTNSIGVLDCNDFHTLTRLTELDLSSNAISSLEGCVFQNLNNLKVLNIEENPVLTLNGALKVTLGKLESLNMHNNRLFELIQGDFGSLYSLRFLDLESSTFNSVRDGAFEGLDNLQTLSISVNDDFKKGYFAGLPRLENLTLHLTLNLNLKMVQQNSVPPFSDLPNLKKLVIKVYETTLYSLSPELLKGLTSLEYFMIEKLNMRSLHPDFLKYTPQLKDLHMVNSDLSDLTPELFWPVPHLQALNLSSNKLMSLDFLARANLTVLNWLKVSDNKLSIINETVFQSLPALTYVDLSGNVLACECSNAGFNQWVQSNNQTQVVNGHQYTCAFPVSQQGKKFLDFDTSYCWTDTAFLCFISSTCVTVFTLLTSFIYHFLRWHLVYSYYLFLAFLYDKKRRNQGAPHRYDAFVSYNVHDEAFVYREMLPVLEREQGWRLCLHHRDFEPGKPIVENITDAIYGSRKTICVISRHYLQSEWCSREIQMASYRLFDEQEDVLILLFMEDIPAHQLSPYYQMRNLVRRRTYLSWQQAGQHTGVFWQKVQQALDTTERPAEHRHLVTGRPSCI